ncbi:MAG TPA: P1 family peptidase [Candidatus Acidoferrales bacterium]|nr:P1 family peptidase [Candidatus Acidoferrales bacterium]
MNRREFNKTLLATAGGSLMAGMKNTDIDSRIADDTADAGGLTDVQGIKVGHWTETRRPTGCTVILCEKGAVAGVDVRGGAPGTRETDLLNPINLVQQIYGLALSGGSAFGLDTASGVMRYLDEHGIGYPAGSAIVPIVPAAILIDLQIGDSKIRPNADSGYAAAKAATSGKIAEGNVGAGAGATVGKYFFGPDSRPMKGGLGTASIRVPNSEIVVAAIVAVNAVGDVRDPRTGAIVAGARSVDGKGFRDTMAQIRAGYRVALPADRAMNSTIGVVATNATLTKVQAAKIAQMAHDGYARSINPVHTMYDGDTIFALSTGTNPAIGDTTAIGALAAEVMAQAVVRAVKQATSIPGYPAYRDIHS